MVWSKLCEMGATHHGHALAAEPFVKKPKLLNADLNISFDNYSFSTYTNTFDLVAPLPVCKYSGKGRPNALISGFLLYQTVTTYGGYMLDPQSVRFLSL